MLSLCRQAQRIPLGDLPLSLGSFPMPADTFQLARMNPYRIAFDLWDSQGDPDPSWNELLSWHFHHGAVISTPESFILARPSHVSAPDEWHNSLSPIESPDPPDCWTVWLAAGSLDALLLIAREHPRPWLAYCRHGSTKVRRVKLVTILRRDSFKNASSSCTATTCLINGTGEGSR